MRDARRDSRARASRRHAASTTSFPSSSTPGCSGIEAYHADHTPEQREALRASSPRDSACSSPAAPTSTAPHAPEPGARHASTCPTKRSRRAARGGGARAERARRGTARATLPAAMETYLIRTFGCQMNKHDSERVAGLLAEQGLDARRDRRGRRRHRLHDVLRARERRRAPPRPGPLAQERQGRAGPDSSSPSAAASASATARRCCGSSRTSTSCSARTTSRTCPRCSTARSVSVYLRSRFLTEATDFASDLPTEREHPWHAWVPITVGCDNFCTLLHRAVRARPRAIPTPRGHRRRGRAPRG